VPHDQDDAANASARRSDLASRRETAHDLSNWLTAKAGFLALLDDPNNPGDEEACRRNLARAQDGLAGLVAAAREAGIVSESQAGVLLGDDIEAAISAVDEVRGGSRRGEDELRGRG